MIKTIVIDLGGVYFRAGTKFALQKIYKLTNAPKEKVDEIFEGYPHKEGFLYRKGKLTKEQFWRAAIEKLKFNEGLAPKIREIWHSSYKPIRGMKELVARLRENYRVIVFSGNIKERFDYLNKKYGLRNDFDDFILSYEAGFNKKEIGFYKILLDRIGCKPRECVFIDDLQEFLDIAKSFGIQTILFKNSNQLKFDLRKFDIRI